MQDIQGRLGPERRLEGRRKTRGATPGTKTHWGRNRKGEDGGRLDGKGDIGGILPVRQKGALPKRVRRRAVDQNIGIGEGVGEVKRKRRAVGSCLPSSNKYNVLSTRIMQSDLKHNIEGAREVRRTLRPLKEVRYA